MARRRESSRRHGAAAPRGRAASRIVEVLPPAPALDLAHPESLRRDATVIGIVGFAHLMSHFFQLALPPLFPLLRAEFGTSYAVLGTLVGVYYAASGISQFASGFAVDRRRRRPGAPRGARARRRRHHRREPRSRRRLALSDRRADGRRQRRVPPGRFRDPQRQRRAAAARPRVQLARHRRQPGLRARAGRELRARRGVRLALRARRHGGDRPRRARRSWRASARCSSRIGRPTRISIR